MSAPREEFIKKVKQWFAYAQDDLRVAQSIAEDPDFSQRIAAFHAQQAAEKSLKAWLIHREIDFPFTHDLKLLLSLCAKAQAPWGSDIDGAEQLGQYATTTRYPELELQVTIEQARKAVALASTVLDATQSSLKDEGLDL